MNPILRRLRPDARWGKPFYPAMGQKQQEKRTALS